MIGELSMRLTYQESLGILMELVQNSGTPHWV